MDIEMLKMRSAIIKDTRAFFDSKNYLEVDTPLLSPDLIPEACLEVFQTERIPPPYSKTKEKQALWLIPSPEIWMKKLIADHKTSIYQICKCFRNAESSGLMHSPEFTMLEYYTMNADYKNSLSITEELFDFLLSGCKKRDPLQDKDLYKKIEPPFIRITMDEAFKNFAGFSLVEALEKNTLSKEAQKLGIETAVYPQDDIYNLVFIHSVEPNLPKEKPVALIDYPSIVPCLAALNEPDNFKHPAAITNQRWELYINGIETANCYSEETDPDMVRDFFISESALKNTKSQVKHNIDENYWKIFSKNFPRCSGVAMGLDRAIMALLGRKTIDAVLPFHL